MSDFGGAMAWVMYVVECCDGTLYTGITTDSVRRVREHNRGKRGARYTRARRPVVKVAEWVMKGHSTALKEERKFKKLSRREKLSRIAEATMGR